MRFRLIPAGEFSMGSPPEEEGRHAEEGPQHLVRVTKAFYLGIYEVTQEQYTRVTGVNPSAVQRNAVACRDGELG